MVTKQQNRKEYLRFIGWRSISQSHGVRDVVLLNKGYYLIN